MAEKQEMGVKMGLGGALLCSAQLQAPLAKREGPEDPNLVSHVGGWLCFTAIRRQTGLMLPAYRGGKTPAPMLDAFLEASHIHWMFADWRG